LGKERRPETKKFEGERGVGEEEGEGVRKGKTSKNGTKDK